MLDAIKAFFEEHIALGGSDAPQDQEHRLRGRWRPSSPR